jgi:hypothetical protein
MRHRYGTTTSQALFCNHCANFGIRRSSICFKTAIRRRLGIESPLDGL